uniref:Uncharacterized protein n=1 Tax=Ascaris lumbricoides TaxID=6252 RepID=A0A0M3I710_ASCLU
MQKRVRHSSQLNASQRAFQMSNNIGDPTKRHIWPVTGVASTRGLNAADTHARRAPIAIAFPSIVVLSSKLPKHITPKAQNINDE